MWRQDDVFGALNASAVGVRHGDSRPRRDAQRRRRARARAARCPLMHGTGAFTSFGVLDIGGSVVTLTSRTFDAAELLDAVQANKVQAMAIVGDAFAKPILRALDAQPGQWDISSLLVIISSGRDVERGDQAGPAAPPPGHDAGRLARLVGSPRHGVVGLVDRRDDDTAKFRLGDTARVITDDGHRFRPGSGEVGRWRWRGLRPSATTRTPEKSAATFLTIDGERYSMPGDYATVEADGTLKLLGRGSVCINTGGEKVFPEEVEEVLKTHPDVRDAVAVGVPDEKWGEAITAMVEAAPGAQIDEADVIAHVKARLAAFKAPKRVLAVDTIGRAANGKVDYKRLKEEATERVGA